MICQSTRVIFHYFQYTDILKITLYFTSSTHTCTLIIKIINLEKPHNKHRIILKSSLSMMTYKYFSRMINVLCYIHLLIYKCHSLGAKHNKTELYWFFTVKCFDFFHISLLKCDHLLRQKLWGRKNLPILQIMQKHEHLPGSPAALLGVSHPSDNVTFTWQNWIKNNTFDSPSNSNRYTVKTSQHNHDSWIHSRCCGGRSMSLCFYSNASFL